MGIPKMVNWAENCRKTVSFRSFSRLWALARAGGVKNAVDGLRNRCVKVGVGLGRAETFRKGAAERGDDTGVGAKARVGFCP